jgi:hypothetical protein
MLKAPKETSEPGSLFPVRAEKSPPGMVEAKSASFGEVMEAKTSTCPS